MPNSELTKRILAGGMKELMTQKPLSKISVGDIIETCGVSRNTFYYHFQDKYDLVNWIFYLDAAKHITDFADYESWADGLLALCRNMQENRKFYINALDIRGQNSFSEYLLDFYHELLTACINAAKGQLELSRDDINFIARFYAHALTGILMDWAREGMRSDPAPKIDRIRSLINGTLLNEIKTHRRN